MKALTLTQPWASLMAHRCEANLKLARWSTPLSWRTGVFTLPRDFLSGRVSFLKEPPVKRFFFSIRIMNFLCLAGALHCAVAWLLSYKREEGISIKLAVCQQE